MSTALYRRYRPETFEEVIGQDHVTGPLRSALKSGRINHAYLFSGPRGCGKTTSARILARCLNCEHGPTDTPCGTCPSCVELATGGPGSLDVVEIDAASHNGVDDARDLRERASFAPVRDRFKIFILDEAHMVTPQGFNALLKLVEEPPPHIKFIFATTEPEKVLETIRSRTHQYPFRLVPPEIMTDYLQLLCDKENIAVGQGVLPLVVRAGGGSVRDSLSVLDQLMAGAEGGQIDYQRAVALLGYTDAALLDSAVDALGARDGSAAFGIVEQLVESGHEPRRFVEDLLQRLRDLVILAVAGEHADGIFAALPDDQMDRMRSQATAWGPARLSNAADLTAEALTTMSGATSPRLLLELLLARILVPGVAAANVSSSDGTAATAAPGSAETQTSGNSTSTASQPQSAAGASQGASGTAGQTVPASTLHSSGRDAVMARLKSYDNSAQTKTQSAPHTEPSNAAPKQSTDNTQRDARPEPTQGTAATEQTQSAADLDQAQEAAEKISAQTHERRERRQQAVTENPEAAALGDADDAGEASDSAHKQSRKQETDGEGAKDQPQQPKSTPSIEAVVNPQDVVKKNWKKILEALDGISRVASTMAHQNVEPGPFSAGTQYLITRESGHANAINNRYADAFAQAIKQVTGQTHPLMAATANKMTQIVSDQIGENNYTQQPNATQQSSHDTTAGPQRNEQQPDAPKQFGWGTPVQPGSGGKHHDDTGTETNSGTSTYTNKDSSTQAHLDAGNHAQSASGGGAGYDDYDDLPDDPDAFVEFDDDPVPPQPHIENYGTPDQHPTWGSAPSVSQPQHANGNAGEPASTVDHGFTSGPSVAGGAQPNETLRERIERHHSGQSARQFDEPVFDDDPENQIDTENDADYVGPEPLNAVEIAAEVLGGTVIKTEIDGQQPA